MKPRRGCGRYRTTTLSGLVLNSSTGGSCPAALMGSAAYQRSQRSRLPHHPAGADSPSGDGARLPGYRSCFCDWKQSRQNTGRPSTGRKGTVVSQPHAAQVAGKNSRRPRMGSEAEKNRPARPRPPPPAPPRAPPEPPPAPPASLFRRLARQAGQRFGSFVRPRSA